MKNQHISKIPAAASLLLLVVTLRVFADPPEGFAVYEGLKEQFVLSLPAGWSVFNQYELLTGGPGELGTVAFCSEVIDGKAMMSGDGEAARKVANQFVRLEIGLIPGFLLDRIPARKGMSCNGFEKNARKEVLKLVSQDPMFGRGGTREKPRAEAVSVGACRGLRIKGKGVASTGAGKMMDIFAVSDGDVLYLFELLNLEEHYAKNVGVFEEVLSTLRIGASPARDFVPYEALKEQFVLSLPVGWSVFNQQEAMTGSPGLTGPVLFCSEKIDGRAVTSGEKEAMDEVMKQLARAEVGEIPGVLLERLPAEKGMSCSGFTKEAQKDLLKLLGTDPMFGADRKTRKKPRAETVTIGGCEGLRIKGMGESRSGYGKTLDVFAVSDGKSLYLFKLLNLEEHYEKNVGVFEAVVSTLTLRATEGQGTD